MKPASTMTREFALSVLRYDSNSGKLYWLERDPSNFAGGAYSPERACAAWNAKFAGKEAFTARVKGYPTGSLAGGKYAAHRLIWLMVHGEMPDFIDHVNGDRADNRIVNLRVATREENNRNRCTAANNSSGVTGVSWDNHHQKWVGMLRTPSGRKRTHYSTSFDEAVAFRKRMEAENGYHPNHGREKVPA